MTPDWLCPYRKAAIMCFLPFPLDGTSFVRAPLRPRAGIKPCPAEPGDVHREKIVAGGDARSAVGDHGVDGSASQDRLEARPQILRRKEPAVGREARGRRMVAGSGDAPLH